VVDRQNGSKCHFQDSLKKRTNKQKRKTEKKRKKLENEMIAW